MSLSASYDVDIAKKHGIAAAAIYNKLVYLSRYTTREDGFCWRTSDELENELGLTIRAQRVAVERLEAAGMIITKNTYIVGTMVKCKHFYITDRDIVGGKSDFDNMTNQKVTKRQNQESDKMTNHINNNQTNNKTINNKKENIKEKGNKSGSGNVFLEILQGGEV